MEKTRCKTNQEALFSQVVSHRGAVGVASPIRDWEGCKNNNDELQSRRRLHNVNQ